LIWHLTLNFCLISKVKENKLILSSLLNLKMGLNCFNQDSSNHSLNLCKTISCHKRSFSKTWPSHMNNLRIIEKRLFSRFLSIKRYLRDLNQNMVQSNSKALNNSLNFNLQNYSLFTQNLLFYLQFCPSIIQNILNSYQNKLILSFE